MSHIQANAVNLTATVCILETSLDFGRERKFPVLKRGRGEENMGSEAVASVAAAAAAAAAAVSMLWLIGAITLLWSEEAFVACWKVCVCF